MAGQWLVSDNPDGLRHQNLLHRMVFYTIFSAFPSQLENAGRGIISSLSHLSRVFIEGEVFGGEVGGEWQQ